MKKITGITYIVIVIIIVVIGSLYIIGKNHPISSTTTSTDVQQTNRQIAVDKSGVDKAIKDKNPSYCREYYGNNSGGYYCESLYMGAVKQWWPTEISLCKSMGSSETEVFYKDNCFRGVAELNQDKSICNYLSTPSKQTSCVAQVDADTYAKTELCGPLFKSNYVPGFTECKDYVESQKNPTLCNMLTPAWAKQECLDKIK